MADNNSEPEAFDYEVSADLAKYIPEEIRADPEKLKEWVDLALDYGLKAILQTSIGIDTKYVESEFETWKAAVSKKLIGKDSDFEKGLKLWFSDSGGTFQKAFDLDDKKSPLGKFLTRQKSDRTTHEQAVSKLITDLQVHLGYEAGAADEAEKGTGKGRKFQDEIANYLDEQKGTSDKVEVCGEMTIDGTSRKVGDVLVEIDDPGTNDLKIIAEAKAGAYTLRGGSAQVESLPDQMTAAMQLRLCQGSIGVTEMKKVKRSKGPWIELDRHRIIVAVDRGDDDTPQDFTLLYVAYKVLRYRIIQDARGQGATVDSLDSAKFDRLLKEILSKLETTSKMKRACTDAAKSMTGVHADIVKLETDIKAKVVELQGLIASALQD
jgi:hypothetical protein